MPIASVFIYLFAILFIANAQLRRQTKLAGDQTGEQGVGDVFDKEEAERDVLVLGSVHVDAQLVGGGPERLLV